MSVVAHILRAQKQQAQKIHTQLQTYLETNQHYFKEWNQQQILVEKQKILHKMKIISYTVNQMVFEPTEIAMQYRAYQSSLNSNRNRYHLKQHLW